MNRAKRSNNTNTFNGSFEHQGPKNNRQAQQGAVNQTNKTPIATPSTSPSRSLKPILKNKPTPAPVPKQEPEKPQELEKVPKKEHVQEVEMQSDDNSYQMDDSANADSEEMAEVNGNGSRKPFFKKIFGGVRKKPSIRAKERKIRQNRHLRKVILPKNALMALYEVKGIQIGDFIINTSSEGGFNAMVTVNNSQYEGTGNSKSNAKANACEKALRDYVIKKMVKRRTAGQSGQSEPMDTNESNNGEDTNGEDSASATEDADDVPMVNLASYALYKLFTAWENEGFHVPEFHSGPNPSAQNNQPTESAAAKKPVGRTELPANWETMHPATLLCIMRPRLIYTDCGSNGDSAYPSQTVKVTVDDQEFIGTGRSKKVARKNVAISVCNTLFNTNFQSEE